MTKKYLYSYFILYALLIILNIKNLSLNTVYSVTTVFLIFGVVSMLCKKDIVKIVEKVFLILLLIPFIVFGSYLAGMNKGSIVSINFAMSIVNLLIYLYMIFLLIKKNNSSKVQRIVFCSYIIVSLVLLILDITITRNYGIVALLNYVINILLHLLVLVSIYNLKKSNNC